jgi:hypothetical protein
LVIFFAVTAAVLLTLTFVHQRPLAKLISWPNLAAGAIIAVACFLLGTWFGANLIATP